MIAGVFADDQVSPWTHRDVVGVLQDAVPVGFGEQAQLARGRCLPRGSFRRTGAVYENLTQSLRTPNRAGKCEIAPGVAKSFSPGEDRGAPVVTL